LRGAKLLSNSSQLKLRRWREGLFLFYFFSSSFQKAKLLGNSSQLKLGCWQEIDLNYENDAHY